MRLAASLALPLCVCVCLLGGGSRQSHGLINEPRDQAIVWITCIIHGRVRVGVEYRWLRQRLRSHSDIYTDEDGRMSVEKSWYFFRSTDMATIDAEIQPTKALVAMRSWGHI
jgi:hypothetical protein